MTTASKQQQLMRSRPVLSSSSVSSSLFGGPSEGRADCRATITIIAPSFSATSPIDAGNDFVAYANNSGVIGVYHLQSQTKQQIAKSMFGMAVEQHVWDNKHKLLANAFSNGAVTVKAISTSVVHPTSPDQYLLCLVSTRPPVKGEAHDGPSTDCRFIVELRTYTWDKLERLM